ncbi:MAG: hypothetical protein F6K28_37040 [Microcoleus sp. SIO2G3]|nr:hypothetical protein [Microcoleus sp. SIO2G3]
MASASQNSADAIGEIITLLIVVLFLGSFWWSLTWVYADAEERGKPGWLVVLIVLFFGWPLSLLLWLVFRPD